ncbi:kinase-like protein [Xylariaceae sp. FL0016]|nr:kinase-like protein [Xylariaceae sp. FL0016]
MASDPDVVEIVSFVGDTTTLSFPPLPQRKRLVDMDIGQTVLQKVYTGAKYDYAFCVLGKTSIPNNVSVLPGPQGPTPPGGRRRRRNANRQIPGFNQLAVRQADTIKRYFSEYPSAYKYEGPIANGAHGIVVCVRQFPSANPPREEKLFAVKRAYNEEDVDKLDKEIAILRALRGAPHIIQMIDRIDPDPFDALNKPTLIMEYVNNGTLGDLIMRLKTNPSPTMLPNRVLIRMFSCLLRTVIAMAWPGRGAPGLPYKNEQFPNDWQSRPTTQLIHGDIHEDNVLIGELDPSEGEHDLVPILKLIDFGSARYDQNPYVPNIGINTNIFDIGRIMRMLITHDTTWDLNPLYVAITVDGNARLFQTASPTIARPHYPKLEDDIRNAVLLCTATDPRERPTMDWLTGVVNTHMEKKTPRYYRRRKNSWERGSKIQDLVHDLIFYPDWV